MSFLLSCAFFFFFQAEDGIRDSQESRGLVDVYKRQSILCVICQIACFHGGIIAQVGERGAINEHQCKERKYLEGVEIKRIS